MIDYLKRTPGVRDVVVSGGDVANMPWKNLESLPHAGARHRARSATSARDQGLMGLPPALAQPEVVEGLERVARRRPAAGVNLAIHTHVNHANSVTPLVAQARTALESASATCATRACSWRASTRPRPTARTCASRSAGRGEHPAVLLLHVRHDPVQRALARVRSHGQHLQHAIMGYLPGLRDAAHRQRRPVRRQAWVHQVEEYDHERGISYWTKNYRNGIELPTPTR
jgi:lysine 2,3-aminomutase